MSTNFDAIVLGVGGMGSATLYHLACRGLRVLGIEQFALGHHRGSSHGQTRVIRTAYYEHPDYVPLLQQAFAGWYELEQRGQHLLTECGCLSIGSHDGELITGIRDSAQRHDLAITNLSAADLRALDMPFQLADHETAIYEEQAGFLRVEDCVMAFQFAAKDHGAAMLDNSEVVGWQATDHGVTVETAEGTLTAAKLIITAGGWATRWLADVGVPFTVMRQVQNWLLPTDPARFRRDRFPVFLHDSPVGIFYGIPMIDPTGVKIAEHYGAPELASPGDINWTATEDDLRPVRAYTAAHLPGLGECTSQEVCLYTLSPDRHFVIDWHPTSRNVVFAAGFSGHGFKFVPVVGEALAIMATSDRDPFDSDLFRLSRFAPPREPGA
jgi:sarcosine oxidase